jgi:hypothetical protein
LKIGHLAAKISFFSFLGAILDCGAIMDLDWTENVFHARTQHFAADTYELKIA